MAQGELLLGSILWTSAAHQTTELSGSISTEQLLERRWLSLPNPHALPGRICGFGGHQGMGKAGQLDHTLWRVVGDGDRTAQC